LGVFVVFLATVHGILEFISMGVGLTTDWGNDMGILSWICGFAMFITALEPIRRKKFEVFYYSHYLFLLFYVFGGLHYPDFIPYAIGAAVVYFLDRIIRLFWGVVPKKTTLLRIKEGKDGRDNVVQLRVTKSLLSTKLGLYKVGQYVFLNFPSISWLEWHPFSISSGPDERTLEVHIKGLGRHTVKVVQQAAKNENMWVRVDGPYGDLKLNYRRSPAVLLVAGGIGFTPMLGILKDMYDAGDLDPRYKSKPHCVEAVYVVWSIQTVDQYYWFAEELNECYKNSEKPGMPRMNVSIFITQKEDGLEPVFTQGRPDFEGIFADVGKRHNGKTISVFTCGPKAMVKTCWDCSVAGTKDGTVFTFHQETFEF